MIELVEVTADDGNENTGQTQGRFHQTEGGAKPITEDEIQDLHRRHTNLEKMTTNKMDEVAAMIEGGDHILTRQILGHHHQIEGANHILKAASNLGAMAIHHATSKTTGAMVLRPSMMRGTGTITTQIVHEQRVVMIVIRGAEVGLMTKRRLSGNVSSRLCSRTLRHWTKIVRNG
jgi:hypothetical protein